MEAYSEIFKYDPDSPSGLVWKTDRYSGRDYNILQALSGGPAGCVNARCYYTVEVDGKKKAAHRVIWELFNGEIPDKMLVDHVNGIRTDNRIENLRIADHRVNNCNRRVSDCSVSGYSGVNYVIVKNKGKEYHYWRTRVYDSNNKVYDKVFSVAKLGYQKALDMAISYRFEELERHDVLRYYSERHLGISTTNTTRI